MAEIPANRALAEDAIARNLGVPLGALGDPSESLHLPSMAHVKFKRYKHQVDSKVAPAILIAQRVAKVVVESIDDALPPFNLNGESAATIRQRILRRHRYVDLESLLEACWELGVVVLHLVKTPQQSKRFDGLAMFCGERPVLVLGSRRDSPAWLAFHLAHECGHILAKHVTAGSPPLADSDLMSVSTDQQEEEADRLGCEILTGEGNPRIQDLKFTGPKLALVASQYGPDRGIDPGVMTLIYGKSNDRWGVAQNALKFLSLDEGAHRAIFSALTKRFNPDDLSESAERFLTVLSPPS